MRSAARRPSWAGAASIAGRRARGGRGAGGQLGRGQPGPGGGGRAGGGGARGVEAFGKGAQGCPGGAPPAEKRLCGRGGGMPRPGKQYGAMNTAELSSLSTAVEE